MKSGLTCRALAFALPQTRRLEKNAAHMIPSTPSSLAALTPTGMAPPDSLRQLAERLQAFAAARDWGPYHSPKNLASALIVEAAELLEPFQWLSPEQSRNLPPPAREAVALEMADVLLYLVQLASVLQVDLVDAAWRKLAINEARFPRTALHQDAPGSPDPERSSH